jgi:hypothetical protein
MAGVVQPRRAAEYDKPNTVLKVVDVKTAVVIYTNSEGRKSMCLAYSFGKDVEDGMPGVYVVAEEQQMTETLRVAGKLVRDGVRRWIAGAEEVKSENIPAALLGVVGDVATSRGPNLADLDVGGEEG